MVRNTIVIEKVTNEILKTRIQSENA